MPASYQERHIEKLEYENSELRTQKAALAEALERCQAYASSVDFEMNAEQRLLQVHRIAKAAIEAAEEG